jgi:hypothetical protein
MFLLQKVEVLDKLVRHHYRTNKSTIHFINKNEDKSRRSVKTNAPSSAKISCVSHEQPFLEQTGSALYVWLEDTTQKWLSVSGAVLREKAMPVKAGFKTVFKSKDLAFKVLLVLGNAPQHPQLV